MTPEHLRIPVAGGELFAARWPGDGPVVVAAHGITGNHVSWNQVAAHLEGRVTLIAPDLRGRGGSNGLPGPFGMAAHARDLVSVLDHLGLDRSLIVGHSMGAYVAVVMAQRFPERVESLLLVDGGVPLPRDESLSVDEVIERVIGPAMARLAMTFPTRSAYYDFWRAHPSFEEWSPVIEEYLDYDIAGSEEPELRSSVSADAARADAEDTLVTSVIEDAVAALSRPAAVLRAERGMFNQIPPLIPDELAAAHPQIRDLGTVAGVNHYTLLLAPAGASAVADAIVASLPTPTTRHRSE